MKRFFKYKELEAGVDEAGRGCLAGPVTAAAVILPQDFKLEGLTDSKQVSKKLRNAWRPLIEEQSLAWSVVHIWEEEIGQKNILGATFHAMQSALGKLNPQPKFICIDGNRFPGYGSIPHSCQVKGDARFLHIAAASILAKTHRDEIMEKLDLDFPDYQWAKNKGYPTKAHRKAISEIGPCKHHRPGFQLLPVQKELPFTNI